ncbi:MAG: hypothetical protein MUP44_05445, partial [Anaerolineales bacterium]|nr:hypothetical protein [Anaerolineales bacterium]
MAEVVNMPKLGFDMAEGVLIRWVVSEGQAIEKGQVLAEIETDKATVEVEASASGTVRKHFVSEGTSVPVGHAIAVIGDADEQLDLASLIGSEPAVPASPESTPETEALTVAAPADAALAGQGSEYPQGAKASPVARRMA